MLSTTPRNQPSLPEKLSAYLNSCGLPAWYTAYDGAQERVGFVTQQFANWFNLTPSEIVARATYLAINGPQAPNEKYKTDDQTAIKQGFLLLREGSPPLTVVKIQYREGILGFADSAAKSMEPLIENLEPRLLEVLIDLKNMGELNTTLAQFLPSSSTGS